MLYINSPSPFTQQPTIVMDTRFFSHVQHIGVDGSGFQLGASNRALGKQLLDALGLNARSKEELEAALAVIDEYGTSKVCSQSFLLSYGTCSLMGQDSWHYLQILACIEVFCVHSSSA